jgi:hypothetical protein
VNLYNSSDTSLVTVLDSYSADVTYADYVIGDTTTTAVAAAVELSGIGSIAGTAKATITGSVQNASAVGQPGAAVVVSAEGVLFYDVDQTLYAKDTITVFANEFGTYSVVAISHTVNAKGHPVSLVSGGKTATTLLKNFLPDATLTASTLVFSWDLPATLVKNTTYVLTATLTDKWGNPVPTTGNGSVDFVGTGSIQVNGLVTGTVSKNFDKDGKAIVFIRSIKDIAGPGSVTANVKSVTGQYVIDPLISGGLSELGSLVSVTTDAKATVWDETKFSSSLETVVNVLDVAPAASSDTIVNVGTFSGKLVVYALNAAGSEVSYKIAGKWVTQVVTSDLLQRYDRVVGATGKTIKVDIYVDGVLKLAKSVVTK